MWGGCDVSPQFTRDDRQLCEGGRGGEVWLTTHPGWGGGAGGGGARGRIRVLADATAHHAWQRERGST